MNKIVIAFDGGNFSDGAFEFARWLNEREPVLLTGLFLPKVDEEAAWSFSGALEVPVYMPVITEASMQVLRKSIEKFEKLCVKHGIEFRTHAQSNGFLAADIVKETKYADLLILGSERFYGNLGTEYPNEYLRKTLRVAECPVVVVPEQSVFPEGLILSYDGSASSVFAIKQFAYLFPQLAKLSTIIVYSDTKEDIIPDLPYIEELASRHFPNLTLFKLEADPRHYFSTWLADKKTAFLVAGSFGRSGISEMLSKSFASEVIADHKLPVFIAHK